jgi:5-methylcytosine-specific restriction endonuclease McrA
MPRRIASYKPRRLREAPPAAELERPNAAQRGYCSPAHKRWRMSVLIRDAFQCRECRRVCSDPREAHADHISPVVHGTERCESGCSRYDVANGQTLCIRCHAKKTLAEQKRAKRRAKSAASSGQSDTTPSCGGAT